MKNLRNSNYTKRNDHKPPNFKTLTSRSSTETPNNKVIMLRVQEPLENQQNLIHQYLIFQKKEQENFQGWIKISGNGSAYSITADGGEDVVVSRVHEVEGDGVKGTLALVEAVADSILPLLRRRQRPYCRLAAQTRLRHGAPPSVLGDVAAFSSQFFQP